MKPPYRVFVSTQHPGDAVQKLAEKFDTTCSGSDIAISHDELLRSLQDKDAIVSVLLDKFDAGTMDACPSLKVIGNVAVGFDNIDVKAATERSILVVNTPGVLDNTTADLAFALLLASARRLAEADQYVRAGEWQKWKSDLFLGTDVSGKTIGIIGFGRIGQAMARRAHGFGMSVLYSQRNRAAKEIEQQLEARFVSQEELLSSSDFVSLHCPLTAATRHLLSDKQFAQMKHGAFLINTSRGPVVDEEALVRALQSGKLGGAGLDVFEMEPKVHPALIEMKNVVLAPHIGSASVETRSAMARLAAQSVIEALCGRLPQNAVNPDVWDAFAKRLANPLCC